MNLTVILTNWKRKQNLLKIVDQIKKQTLKSRIIVIDNSSFDPNNCFLYENDFVEIIKKDNSLMCWQRWEEAIKQESKYVCIMDDDLNFTRNDVLQDCFNYMEINSNIDCIGLEGVRLIKSKGYFDSNHQIAKSNHIIPISIVKGRFMFLKKDSLIGLDMTPDLTCDDIKVSSHLKTKILPPILWNSFQDLPQGNEALSGKQFQSIKRDYATKKYFKY